MSSPNTNSLISQNAFEASLSTKNVFRSSIGEIIGDDGSYDLAPFVPNPPLQTEPPFLYGALAIYGIIGGLGAGWITESEDSYLDPIMRVRRDSDNAEKSFVNFDIVTGALETWVTETDVNGNGYVTKLYDQSGNGNHALQSDNAKQPKIVHDGSLVVFDGGTSNQYAIWNYSSDSEIGLIPPINLSDGQEYESYSVLQSSDTDGVLISDGFGSEYVGLIQDNSTDSTRSLFIYDDIIYINKKDYTGLDRDSLHYNTFYNKPILANCIFKANGETWNQAPFRFLSLGNGSSYSADVKYNALVLFPGRQDADRTTISNEFINNFNVVIDRPAYDTDAAAYFSAVETAGGSFDLTAIDGTYTESYVKTAHSDFYAGLKTDGLWDKLTEFYLLVGKTFDGLTVKGKGTGTLTNNNFVSGDLLAAGTGAGLSGDGSTKYLDTGRPSGGTQNDSSLSVYGTQPTTNLGFAIANNNLDDRKNFIAESGGQFYYVVNELPPSSALNLGAFPAYVIASRISSSSSRAYHNGNLALSNSKTSSAPDTSSITLFADASQASTFTEATLTFAHIGTGLTDTDAANLSLRVNKLMYDLGCETYIDQGILDAMTLDADAQTYAEAVLSAGGNFEAI